MSTAGRRHRPLPPPLPFDEAEAHGLTVLGTCDWGGCNREAWGVRWHREHGGYLTVCHPCSGTGVRGLPSQPSPTDTEETGESRGR